MSLPIGHAACSNHSLVDLQTGQELKNSEEKITQLILGNHLLHYFPELAKAIDYKKIKNLNWVSIVTQDLVDGKEGSVEFKVPSESLALISKVFAARFKNWPEKTFEWKKAKDTFFQGRAAAQVCLLSYVESGLVDRSYYTPLKNMKDEKVDAILEDVYTLSHLYGIDKLLDECRDLIGYDINRSLERAIEHFSFIFSSPDDYQLIDYWLPNFKKYVDGLDNLSLAAACLGQLASVNFADLPADRQKNAQQTLVKSMELLLVKIKQLNKEQFKKAIQNNKELQQMLENVVSKIDGASWNSQQLEELCQILIDIYPYCNFPTTLIRAMGVVLKKEDLATKFPTILAFKLLDEYDRIKQIPNEEELLKHVNANYQRPLYALFFYIKGLICRPKNQQPQKYQPQLKENIEAAIIHFKAAVKTYSKCMPAYVEVARCNWYLSIEEENQKKKESILKTVFEDLSLALKINSSYLEASKRRAWYYKEVSQFDLAIEDFTKVLQIDSQDISSLTWRAECYVKKAQYQIAIDDYEKVLNLASDHLPALDGKAQCLYQLGEFALALDVFDKIVKKEEQSHFRLYQLDCFFRLKKYKEGISYCQSAVMREPLNLNFIVKLGEFFFLDGQLEKAVAQFNQALEIDPNNAELYFQRATCYSHLAQKDRERYRKLKEQPNLNN